MSNEKGGSGKGKGAKAGKGDEKVNNAPVNRISEDGEKEGRYSMTELAALCGVTEQTVRRWWALRRIPAPTREGRAVYWPAKVGNSVIDTYKATGEPSPEPKVS